MCQTSQHWLTCKATRICTKQLAEKHNIADPCMAYTSGCSLCYQCNLPRVGFGAHVCYHCRISPPRFPAECRKRRLNQGSLFLLFFWLFALFDLYLVFACLLSCTVFVLSYCMFIFLYCFVCQYQSSDWLWRPPPKWPILCRVGR